MHAHVVCILESKLGIHVVVWIVIVILHCSFTSMACTLHLFAAFNDIVVVSQHFLSPSVCL